MSDHEAMLGGTRGPESRDAKAGKVNYENQQTKTEGQKGEQEVNSEDLCQRLKKQYPIEVQMQGNGLQPKPVTKVLQNYLVKGHIKGQICL